MILSCFDSEVVPDHPVTSASSGDQLLGFTGYPVMRLSGFVSEIVHDPTVNRVSGSRPAKLGTTLIKTG